jgi:hypothetical protein
MSGVFIAPGKWLEIDDAAKLANQIARELRDSKFHPGQALVEKAEKLAAMLDDGGDYA